jgi:hypothetical protein
MRPTPFMITVLLLAALALGARLTTRSTAATPTTVPASQQTASVN